MVELVMSGVGKLFGRREILSDIELSLASERLLAILGPSGGGKTTLLRLIAGFERCDQGTIRLGAAIVARPGLHMPPEKRRVGYVAQDGALFPHLSVAENITFGLPKPERRNTARVDELLELVGLSLRYRSQFPHELSGGEQQRVALARALAPRPQLVLLDEPFSALDAGLRVETRRSVIAALQQTRATAVLVTHDQAEALAVGDQVAVLLEGRVAQIAAPETLYNQPATVAIARFLGDSNFISGDIRGGFVDCILGRLPLDNDMPDGPAKIRIRPEQVCLLAPDSTGLTRARVIAIDYYGHGKSVTLDVAGEVLNARVSGNVPVHPGDSICLVIEGPVRSFS